MFPCARAWYSCVSFFYLSIFLCATSFTSGIPSLFNSQLSGNLLAAKCSHLCSSKEKTDGTPCFCCNSMQDCHGYACCINQFRLHVALTVSRRVPAELKQPSQHAAHQSRSQSDPQSFISHLL